MPLSKFTVTNKATQKKVKRQPITSDFKPRPALLDQTTNQPTELITARSVRFMSSGSIGLDSYDPEISQEVAYTNFTPAEGASNSKNSLPERKFYPT